MKNDDRSCVGRWCFALALLLGQGADAATFDILVDSDNNPATGCTVTTSGGPFAGVEFVVTTTVDTSASPPRVTGVTRQGCLSGGIFGSAVLVDAGGWPMGVGIGTAGYDLLETHFPVTAPYGQYRLGFVYSDALTTPPASDVLFTTNGLAGSAIVFALGSFPVIPTLGRGVLLLLTFGLAWMAFCRLRQHRVSTLLIAGVLAAIVASTAWAAIVLDGMIGDWAGVPALATDPAGDAPNGVDMNAVFVKLENPQVFVRVDVKSAPTFDTRLYVANASSQSVTVFRLDASGDVVPGSGVDTRVPPSSSDGTTSVALHPNAQRLYLGKREFSGNSNVVAFKLDASGDVIAGSAADVIHPGVVFDASSLVVNPSGSRLYAASYFSHQITTYSLDTNGDVVPGTAINISWPADGSVESISVNRAGTRLYLATFRSVVVFSLDPNGDIIAGSAAVANLTENAQGTTGISLNPAGTRLYVYVSLPGDNFRTRARLTVFSLDGSGNVIPGSGINVPAPESVRDPRGIAVDPRGTHVYTANGYNEGVTQYALDASGDLRAGSAITVNDARAQPVRVKVNRAGTRLYVANFGHDNDDPTQGVSVFRLDTGGNLIPGSGTLVPLPAGAKGAFDLALR